MTNHRPHQSVQINEAPSAANLKVKETISAMLRQEHNYCCYNYLRLLNGNAGGGGVEPFAPPSRLNESVVLGISNRARVCGWMFSVINHLAGLERETAIVAMSLLDRYLCSDSALASRAVVLDRNCYCLVAMTCLCIAVKLTGRTLNASVICAMYGSGGDLSPTDLIRHECHVLRCLKWKLAGPTALQFVGYMLKLLPRNASHNQEVLYAHCRLQTELAVGDYAMVCFNRSTIAVATILNSIAQVEVEDFPLHDRNQYTVELSRVIGLDLESKMMTEVKGRLLRSLAVLAEECARAEEEAEESIRAQDNESRPNQVSNQGDLRSGAAEVQVAGDIPTLVRVTSCVNPESTPANSSDDSSHLSDDDFFRNLEAFCKNSP